MQYVTFDPRPTEGAKEVNDAIFAHGPVLGIEVTIPALAKRCIDNIDPQHKDLSTTESAIEASLQYALPHEFTVLATIRTDLDSLGAMAVIALRLEGKEFSHEVLERVKLIGDADKFARSKAPWEATTLPTLENPWPYGEDPLAALGAAVADFKKPLADRVQAVRTWLENGSESDVYRKRVREEREKLITSLMNGSIVYRLEENIAVVTSQERAATYVGFSLAPVVIALNPIFQQEKGTPYKKFTISTYAPKYADIQAALAELSVLEPGWGGSVMIGGSPQGVSSQLTMEQVVEVVKKHVR